MKNTKNDHLFTREVRLQKARERLGDNPRCIHCGEHNPHALEFHHIAGRKYDDDGVILCRNCHRTASDWQKDHPPIRGGEPHPMERIAHFLLGVADLFELLITRLREFGHHLIAQVAANEASDKGERS